MDQGYETEACPSCWRHRESNLQLPKAAKQNCHLANQQRSHV